MSYHSKKKIELLSAASHSKKKQHCHQFPDQKPLCSPPPPFKCKTFPLSRIMLPFRIYEKAFVEIWWWIHGALKLWGSFYRGEQTRRGEEKNHLFGWHTLPLLLYCVSTFHNDGDKCPAPNAYPLTMAADITWLKAQGPVGKEARRIKSIRHG